ncbi:MAG: peptidoglycan-binding domain-containing protein [Minisyncoccia bacterium]
MEKRLFKQIIIASVLGIFTLLIGFIFYFKNKPAPTCSDNIKNQREEDVDCGGPCIPCDLKNNPPLVIQEKPYFILSDTNKIDIVFKILNKSNQWGVKYFSYKINLYGDNNQTQTLLKNDFVLPLELKTIILPLIDVAFIPKSIDIQIDKPSIIWEKPFEGINLSIGDPFVLSNLRVIEPQTPKEQEFNVYLFTKTLVLNTKDPEVFNLQKVLAQNPEIYPEGEITGVFDKATESAVKRFQKKYGIRITGQVGPQTRAKLNELYGPSEIEPFSYTFTKTLKLNSSGIEVINLQRALMIDSTEHPRGNISGVFDKATEKAVKEFQARYDLTPTGIVDAPTREKLNELFAPVEKKPVLPEDYFESYEASLRVKGELYNMTPFRYKKGQIAVVLCDKTQKPITSGATFLEKIYYGQTNSFMIQWQKPLPKNLVICEKTISINILDKDNIFVTSK